MSGAPVFAGCHQGSAATAWSLGSRGQRSFHSWVPWDCNNQRLISWQTTTPRHWTDRTETSSAFLQEAYLLILASGAVFRFGVHLEAMEVLSGNINFEMPSFYSSTTLPQLTGISQKGAYTLIFMTVAQWTPSNHPARGPSGLMLIYKTVYLHSLKAAAWGSSFQSAWN